MWREVIKDSSLFLWEKILLLTYVIWYLHIKWFWWEEWLFLKKERILRYFVYDIINNINTTDKITIKEFKYDSKTLVNSFYHELLNIYVKLLILTI